MERQKAETVTVGDKLELKTSVGRYQPIYYAGASGDFNPIHIDSDFGKMVGLGGSILQGLCTMAFCVRCQTDWAGGDPGALKKVKVRFASPVRPEDVVTVKGEVTRMEGKNVLTEFAATTQKGEEVISMAWAEMELG